MLGLRDDQHAPAAGLDGRDIPAPCQPTSLPSFVTLPPASRTEVKDTPHHNIVYERAWRWDVSYRSDMQWRTVAWKNHEQDTSRMRTTQRP